MERRSFLKTTVVVAGGVWAVGCGDDGAVAPDPFEGLTVDDGDAANLFPQSVASGDPKDASVILWTRLQTEASEARESLLLQVALDEDFTNLVDVSGQPDIVARRKHDHCVRVRLTGLEPGTTYYYRFGWVDGDTVHVSRTGRTRTAPAAGDEAKVRFAVASCQDWSGRYYHAYADMAEQDLDFFVHLGDYVYETLGDASFQSTSGRSASFDDEDGALQLGEGDATFYAARSLDNYRQLYKLFRGDRDLQRAHERFPMVAVWDDHEFTDDSHGQTGTYLDGRENERDPERRANADQAWFEYMPVDYEDPDFEYDRDAADFPRDLTIYRDLRFGKHLHLVMTDLRRYRSDHLVPEDAFPGAVAATEAELSDALGELPSWAEAYVDLDDGQYSDLKSFLNAQAESLGWVEGDFEGRVGIDFINAQIQDADADDKPDPLDTAGAPLGMTYARLFKTERFSQVGSRYVLRAEALQALSAVRWQQDDGASEQAMGERQESWFVDTLTDSEATWKVWGNTFTFTPRHVDLREQPLASAIGLQDLLLLSAEDWDGMPSRRARLLEAVGDVENLVAVTGDIHAFFAGVARAEGDTEGGLIEFVSGMISSAAYQDLLEAVATSIDPLAVALAQAATDLMLSSNPHLAHVRLDRAGYGLCEVEGDELRMDYRSIDAAEVSDEDSSAEFEVETYVVTAGDKRLKRPTGDDGLEVFDDASGEWM